MIVLKLEDDCLKLEDDWLDHLQHFDSNKLLVVTEDLDKFIASYLTIYHTATSFIATITIAYKLKGKTILS